MRRPAVYMIGAGPGDPGLLTVRGRDCLSAADVVIHDHLIPAPLLQLANSRAELIDVGGAAPQPMAQEAISYLLAEKAREGKLVARLKWGDPFVFDRGGEEALFLHAQGIPFEVVPGIPAGVGVPAYAGVPVTYPGGGDTITLVRGYEDERRTVPDIDWASLARLEGTVVCYAGAQQLPRILDAMQANGWPADEPAVAIYNGTLPTQETVDGTVGTLRALVASGEPRRRGPAILVVGRVAAFREHLRWFDARPLFGRRVLVTRPRDQAADLVDRLTDLGAEVVLAPMIRIDPPADPEPLQRAAAHADQFDWVVFTSVNAVEAFMIALMDGTRDVRALKGLRICAVGPATAARVASYSLKVDLVPQEFKAEAVAAMLIEHVPLAGTRVLLPRADIGREVIGDALRQAGALVTEVLAYRTVPAEELSGSGPDVYGLLLEGRIDVVTFTSASAVKNFAGLYGADQAADLLRKTVVATIGPATAAAASRLGIDVSVQPASYTVPALVDAIAAHFAAQAS